MPSRFDLVVIGSGSAGVTAAQRCRAAGWNVAVIDSKPFGVVHKVHRLVLAHRRRFRLGSTSIKGRRRRQLVNRSRDHGTLPGVSADRDAGWRSRGTECGFCLAHIP